MKRAECDRGTRLFVAHAGVCNMNIYWRATASRKILAHQWANDNFDSKESNVEDVENDTEDADDLFP